MKMTKIMSKSSLTAITLCIILISGLAVGELSISNSKSNFTTTRSDVFSSSDTTPITEYEFMETSTTESIHQNPDIVVTINDEYTTQSIIENKLTLTCSVNPVKNYYFMFLEWIIPKKLNNQPKRVQFDDVKDIQSYRHLIENSIRLSIQNVTFEDNGEIICRLFYFDGKELLQFHDQTYNLQITPPNGNYLKLKVLNNNYLVIRPVGYHSVKWTIQVLSIPHAILEWIGPDNKKIEAISEKIRVNTYNDSSELVIRNLQVSDSGVYTLSVNNTHEKKEIKVTLLVEDLEIIPHAAEYILTINSTEADRTLTCKGNKPVQWYFQDYEGNFINKKSNDSENFSKEQNNYKYSSVLSLSKATYMDTGYYYCTPISVDKDLITNFKKIYIFVQSEKHLFAIPEDFDIIKKTSFNLTIPCRPTSPDINVTLIENGNEKNMKKKYYDSKIGIVHQRLADYSNFTCIAEGHNMIQYRQFIKALDDFIFIINNENSDYVISGQDVTLNCVVEVPCVIYKMEWIVPDNKTERIKYGEIQHKGLESSFIQLNIQNVTVEDEGSYVCAFWIGGERYNHDKKYELKVHTPNEKYLSLKILNNGNTFKRPVGYHSVHWKVQVIAQPEAVLEWRDPSGNKLINNSEKIFIKNDNHSSELTITDLASNDSGNYTLIAYNGAGRKEINVTLLVEDGLNELTTIAHQQDNL